MNRRSFLSIVAGCPALAASLLGLRTAGGTAQACVRQPASTRSDNLRAGIRLRLSDAELIAERKFQLHEIVPFYTVAEGKL